MKCKLRAVWNWLTTPQIWLSFPPIEISGHIMEQLPPYAEDGKVWENLRCVDCGKVEKYWS